MRKLFLISYKATVANKPIVPGVFAIEDPTAGDTAAVLILNHVPNENLDNKGGWNFMFLRDGDMYVSRKDNPLHDPDNPSPFIPEKVPCNFIDTQEAIDAYNADENVDLAY